MATNIQPKIFIGDDMTDCLAETLISELVKEPCLIDPTDSYYRLDFMKNDALERLVNAVNEVRMSDDTLYTIEDVKATIEYARKKFRRHRSARCAHYIRKKKLPAADKWYRWMFYNVKDEGKFVYKHYMPNMKNKPGGAKKRSVERAKIKKLVERYLDMEFDLISGGASPGDYSDVEDKPAKKPKNDSIEVLEFVFKIT